MNKKIESYVTACLSNPEFIKQVASRYGRDGSIGMPELATAIYNLECSLEKREGDRKQLQNALDDDDNDG